MPVKPPCRNACPPTRVTLGSHCLSRSVTCYRVLALIAEADFACFMSTTLHQQIAMHLYWSSVSQNVATWEGVLARPPRVTLERLKRYWAIHLFGCHS